MSVSSSQVSRKRDKKAANKAKVDLQIATGTQNDPIDLAKSENAQAIKQEPEQLIQIQIEQVKDPQNDSKFDKQKSLALMNPSIRDKFDKINGVCDYFYVLEKENEEIQHRMMGELHKDSGDDTKTQLHTLPRGYPQKHLYKVPQICNECIQIDVPQSQYKGSKENFTRQNDEAGLLVYQNQLKDLPNPLVSKRMKTKRSNSVEIETLKFQDNLERSEQGSDGKSGKKTKNMFNMDKAQICRKIQRRDALKAPIALNQEPKVNFIADQNGGKKYDSAQLDEYLGFCDFFMREAPIQGNFCGIWLRGSNMYKENAFKLLNEYNYNFDLAKFHILYPQVMSDPSSKFQMIQISKSHPQDLAKEVANAIIDLQGCKQDEIDEILGKFRHDLSQRINDEQLRYHLTILQKKKIQTPPDIEKMIKASNDFSREIKKKCNIQSGNNKTSQRVPNDKKLKMSELLELYEQQKTFQYITAEMIILEQQVQKAKNWQSKVESIRDQEVHQRVIDQIHDDGKNIPVNFQELMDEVKVRKMHVEDINKKIKEAITVQKTRAGMRAPEGKGRSSKKGAAEATKEEKQEGPDKEQQLRDLKDQAQQMKLQSDQISKLVKTLGEIDKWKQEVNVVFQNEEIEKQNYKRYREQYKSLVVRSSVFQIELQMLKQVKLKLSLIDWRDQVEEIMDQLKKNQKVTLDQILMALEEGREKNFIQKTNGQFVRIDRYHQQSQATVIENKLSNDLQPLFFTFTSLTDIIEQYQNSQKYEEYLQKILNRLENKPSDSSSDEAKENGGISSSLIDMAELQRLDDESSQIKVEVDKIKDFKEKFEQIKQQEQHCLNLISKNSVNGQVVIKSKETFEVFLKAKNTFQQQNITSETFKSFQTQMLPYITWVNKAIKVIKQYYKVLGLKQVQLNLYEPIECSTQSQDPYQLLGDYDSIMALSTTMEQDNFKLFKTMDEGKYIQQILKSTNDLKEELEQYKKEKRDPNFDISNYFRFLEHFQNCGLPVKNEIIEDVKVELKRERWIKKFNDLQNAGKGINQISRQDSQVEKQEENHSPGKITGSKISNLIQNQNSSYVRIKKVDDLVAEFQANQDLKDDNTCSNLANKLMDQQKKSTEWLDKFQLLFNANEQFEPKGGIQQIDDLLKEGELLELKLKEFVDLQVHQKETHDWNKTTTEIFNNSKTVTLDQLKKHKKDTIEITEMANTKFLELLDSLKEIATVWKIFAKAILKIRPIENFQGRMFHQKQINEGKLVQIDQVDQEIFCICRQPENGSYMMICCDFCDMWYHLSCVGLPNDLKLDKIKYKCIGCAMREGKIFDEEYFPSTSQIKSSYFKDQTQVTELEDQSQAHLSSQPQDQYQMEIESLLLEYFQQKQRIPIDTFNYVIQEGLQNIPLKLEEMDDLLFIKSQVIAWMSKVQAQLKHGPESYTILQNFKLINSQNVTDQQVIKIQSQEKDRDDEIMNLIIEQASFPCIDQESIICILQLIKYRDWLRECIQIFYFFNPHSQQAAKLNKQNKHSKIKQRRDVKRLIYKGEIIMNMTCELQETPFIKTIKQNVLVLNDILQQLIANKVTELNQKPVFQINLQQSVLDQIEFELEFKLMAEQNQEQEDDQEFAHESSQIDQDLLQNRINESQLMKFGAENFDPGLSEQKALKIMQQPLKIQIDTSEVAPKITSQKISINLNKESSEKQIGIQGPSQPLTWLNQEKETKFTLPNLNQISQIGQISHPQTSQAQTIPKQMILINTGDQPLQTTHYQLPILNPVIPQITTQAKLSFDNLKKLLSQILEKMKSSMLAGEDMQDKNSELASFLQQTSEYTDMIKTQGDKFIQHDKNMQFIHKGQQLLQKF